MLAFFDILIYVAFAFITSLLAKLSEQNIRLKHTSPRHWDKYLTWFVVFFSLVGGLRWNVGVDSIGYAQAFSEGYDGNTTKESKEILWFWIVESIHTSGLHSSFGLAFCSFFQIYFITKSVQTNRYILVFIPFVLFGGRYWLDCMNAVRQMMVACLFLWSSKFIVEKKLINYLLSIGIGVLIHQSALLLIPFYFIPNKFQIEKKRYALIIILLMCLFIGQSPSFQSAFKFIELIANATNYEDYSDRMVNLLSDSDEALSFGPMMLTYLLIPIFIIWYGPELNTRYSKKLPCFNLWYNLAYFYACGYFLVCNISHIFIRPLMYFSLFQMVLAALLMFHLCGRFKRGNALQQIVAIFFCITIAMNTTWDMIKASGKPEESTTYKSIIFNSDKAKQNGL